MDVNNNKDTGILINNNALLHREYFKEMVKLLGINVIHRSPLKNKVYDVYGEINSSYTQPVSVGCIFEEHPQVKTMKKLGWDTQLLSDSLIIHVPYDLEGLQRGSLFTIPSPFDNDKGRLFRVEEISPIMIYPASITCRLVPEYRNNYDRENLNHTNTNFNLLIEGDEND